MKQYTICFAATGGITINAESEDEALKKFEALSDHDIMCELGQNGFDITDIIDEGHIEEEE